MMCTSNAVPGVRAVEMTKLQATCLLNFGLLASQHSVACTVVVCFLQLHWRSFQQPGAEISHAQALVVSALKC
eukprot:6416644-Amphidinium_carterae.1